MSAAEIRDDTTTEPSLIRVEWFRREPGGGTLFVKPVSDEHIDESSCAGARAADS